MSSRADSLNRTKFRAYIQMQGAEWIERDALSMFHEYILECLVEITKEATRFRDKRRKKTLESSDVNYAIKTLFPDHIQNALDALAPVLEAVKNREQFLQELFERLTDNKPIEQKDTANAAIEITEDNEPLIEENDLRTIYDYAAPDEELDEIEKTHCGYCGLDFNTCSCKYCEECGEHERGCTCKELIEEDIESEEEPKKKKRGWFHR